MDKIYFYFVGIKGIALKKKKGVQNYGRLTRFKGVYSLSGLWIRHYWWLGWFQRRIQLVTNVSKCPPSIFKKYITYVYILSDSQYFAKLSLYSLSVLSLSWPLDVAPFSFSSSSYGFSSSSVIFLLLICGTRLTFFISQLPTSLSLFSNHVDPPPPLISLFTFCILLLKIFLSFFYRMSFCFFCSWLNN